jgi:hypothetical protein
LETLPYLNDWARKAGDTAFTPLRAPGAAPLSDFREFGVAPSRMLVSLSSTHIRLFCRSTATPPVRILIDFRENGGYTLKRNHVTSGNLINPVIWDKTVIGRFLGFGLILMTAGCGLGDQYGYVDGMAAPPTKVSTSVSPDFDDEVRGFLTQEFAHCGDAEQQPEFQRNGSATENRVSYFVRNIRGCVILDGSVAWERLQISFVKTADQGNPVNITIDGWIAYGLYYPPDTQFTEGMESNHQGDLDRFLGQLEGDFTQYEQSGSIK